MKEQFIHKLQDGGYLVPHLFGGMKVAIVQADQLYCSGSHSRGKIHASRPPLILSRCRRACSPRNLSDIFSGISLTGFHRGISLTGHGEYSGQPVYPLIRRESRCCSLPGYSAACLFRRLSSGTFTCSTQNFRFFSFLLERVKPSSARGWEKQVGLKSSPKPFFFAQSIQV